MQACSAVVGVCSALLCWLRSAPIQFLQNALHFVFALLSLLPIKTRVHDPPSTIRQDYIDHRRLS